MKQKAKHRERERDAIFFSFRKTISKWIRTENVAKATQEEEEAQEEEEEEEARVRMNEMVKRVKEHVIREGYFYGNKRRVK